MDMNLSKLWDIVKETGKPGTLQSMSQRVRHDLVTEQQQILVWHIDELNKITQAYLGYIWQINYHSMDNLQTMVRIWSGSNHF